MIKNFVTCCYCMSTISLDEVCRVLRSDPKMGGGQTCTHLACLTVQPFTMRGKTGCRWECDRRDWWMSERGRKLRLLDWDRRDDYKLNLYIDDYANDELPGHLVPQGEHRIVLSQATVGRPAEGVTWDESPDDMGPFETILGQSIFAPDPDRVMGEIRRLSRRHMLASV